MILYSPTSRILDTFAEFVFYFLVTSTPSNTKVVTPAGEIDAAEASKKGVCCFLKIMFKSCFLDLYIQTFLQILRLMC